MYLPGKLFFLAFQVQDLTLLGCLWVMLTGKQPLKCQTDVKMHLKRNVWVLSVCHHPFHHFASSPFIWCPPLPSHRQGSYMKCETEPCLTWPRFLHCELSTGLYLAVWNSASLHWTFKAGELCSDILGRCLWKSWSTLTKIIKIGNLRSNLYVHWKSTTITSPYVCSQSKRLLPLFSFGHIV